MPKKILVIDNSAKIIEMLLSLLEQEGFESISATNYDEGVTKAFQDKPDLVVIETGIGGDEGFEACERLKNMEGPVKPKVIMITAFVDAMEAVKARRAGADDYIVKTADFSNLAEAIKKLLSEK